MDLMSRQLDDNYNRCAELKALLQGVLQLALHATESRNGSILLLDDWSSKILERILVLSESEALDKIDNAQATVLASLLEASPGKEIGADSLLFEPTREVGSALAAALAYQDRVIGLIIIARNRAGSFHELHKVRLQRLACEAPRLIRRMQFADWTRSNGHELRLIGDSQPIKRVEQLIEKYARADCPILISGETGTGKELIAHAIHFNSPRRDKPFVAINCGAFTSDDLLASELFGHVKGAFTDAKSDQKGKFELAHGGTIFLDEVSCMRSVMQVALLRALRYGEIQKLGDQIAKRKVDVRIVAATNQDLKKLVESGSFRADVYSRLKVAEIKIPPLRERKEDIPLLIAYFLTKFSERNKLPVKSMSGEAIQVLVDHHWLDNVAGLENATYAAFLSSRGPEIKLEDLPEEIINAPPFYAPAAAPLVESRDENSQDIMRLAEKMRLLERGYILEVLGAFNWNISKAARSLGLTRRGLQKKIHRYELRGVANARHRSR